MQPKPSSKTAPRITYVAAVNKRGVGRIQNPAAYLAPVPKTFPPRTYGQWKHRSIKEITDHDEVYDVSKDK